MSESIDERVAQAMAQLEETKAAVARAETALRGSSTTARSKDRAVEVTVGPQGELTGLKFLDGKYQTMPAEKLAASVLEAAHKGRVTMARRVMDAFGPLDQLNEHVAGLADFNVDWDRIFGSLLSGGKPGAKPAPAPRRPRKVTGASLSDELSEDN